MDKFEDWTLFPSWIIVRKRNKVEVKSNYLKTVRDDFLVKTNREAICVLVMVYLSTIPCSTFILFCSCSCSCSCSFSYSVPLKVFKSSSDNICTNKQTLSLHVVCRENIMSLIISCPFIKSRTEKMSSHSLVLFFDKHNIPTTT